LFLARNDPKRANKSTTKLLLPPAFSAAFSAPAGPPTRPRPGTTAVD
jgi:hypothetical protein